MDTTDFCRGANPNGGAPAYECMLAAAERRQVRSREMTSLLGDSSGVYHGRGEKDICGETLIGFVCAHGDTFEFLELAEEVEAKRSVAKRVANGRELDG